MKYRNALLKICWTLILFIGLSISAAYAASGKTFTCPAGSRCNPVMEGWCLQHETILSQSLQGKTLKTLTTIYPLGPAVLTSVPNYYNYSSSINCSSKYCCFTSTVDKLIAAIGDVPDAIKKIAKKAKKYINPDEDPDTSDDEDEDKDKNKDGDKDSGKNTAKNKGGNQDSGQNTDKNKGSNTDKKKVQDMPRFLMAILDKNNASIDCWLCFLLENIFVLGDRLATRLYLTLRDGMLALVGIFTVFVLMWMIVKVFIDVTGKSARSFLQQVAGFLARVLVVILILTQSPRFVGEWIFGPFINFSVGMGALFMSDEDNAQSAHISYFSEHYASDDSIMGCTHQQDFWKTKEELMFPKSTCNAMVGLVQLLSIEASTPIQYGQALISYGWQDRYWGVFPRFPAIISGAMMVIFFAVLLIVLPFKVVDIFAQLACVGCLTPLAVVLFAFPTTRKYTQNMWQLFVACVIQLMVLSLMVALVVALFTASMSAETNKSVLAFFLDGKKDEEAAELLRMGGVGVLMLIGMSLICWKLISQAGTFAQQLGGAVSLGLGDALSGALHWFTSRIGGLVAGMMTAGASKIVERVKDKIKKRMPKQEESEESNP